MEKTSQNIKLIIQIPCYNEAEQLAVTIRELPRQLEGIASIEYLVIDDGSSDATSEIARQNGVHHVVRLSGHQGLARAFVAGLEASLEHGADIIVNTDADNQYFAGDIAKLIQPILSGTAAIGIGSRPNASLQHFSRTKKFLQRLGSWLVRQVSQTDVVDAPSGFRAMSRQAASQINIFSDYSYTLESIIQAGQKGLVIVSLPVRTNAPLRPSRLVKNNWTYISQSLLTILRIFVVYRPFQFFISLGGGFFIIGLLLGLRFLWFYAVGNGQGHIQSVI